MRVQRSRIDVLPLTWEVPTAIGLVGILAGLAGVPVGVALAGVARGGEWAAPEFSVTWVGPTPHDALSYACIGVIELVVALGTTLALVMWWKTAGPGATYGAAHRHEVTRVLGVSNLRRRAHTIRPDLTGKR